MSQTQTPVKIKSQWEQNSFLQHSISNIYIYIYYIYRAWNILLHFFMTALVFLWILFTKLTNLQCLKLAIIILLLLWNMRRDSFIIQSCTKYCEWVINNLKTPSEITFISPTNNIQTDLCVFNLCHFKIKWLGMMSACVLQPHFHYWLNIYIVACVSLILWDEISNEK